MLSPNIDVDQLITCVSKFNANGKSSSLHSTREFNEKNYSKPNRILIKVFCSRLRERRVKWRPITWLTRVAHNVLIEHVELDLSGLANDVSTAGRNKSEDKELNCIEIRIRISLFFTSIQRSSINFNTKALFFSSSKCHQTFALVSTIQSSMVK